ncbi:hypothetical protein TNIN_406671 [Trichonephila inaurata madagascariensis]|uniref:TGF-beta family profile domain-containing protein n=1 Tax=Trichonephila inaurata madagascariensis TaxID=2747483 RepID=A0A8X7CHR6_9ARAC|nr:hypothetical protein TNIN_406671 [Trichonephila inaurata madagascariensis]
MKIALLFVILLVQVLGHRCNDLEELETTIENKIRLYDIARSAPQGLARIYLDWDRNLTHPGKLTSDEIEVVPGRNILKYNMRYSSIWKKTSNYTKVEFWIELHGVPNTEPSFWSSYTPEIEAFCKKIKLTPLEPGTPFINGDFVHIVYDMTEFYFKLKTLKGRNVRFKMRLPKQKGGTGYGEMTIKSFMAFYEEVSSEGLPYLEAFKSIGNSKNHILKIPNGYLKNGKNRKPIKACALEDLNVSFDMNLFNSYVIAPNGANIHICKGFCGSPKSKSTTHSLIQMHQTTVHGDTSPCCTPVSWDPLTLIMYDYAEKVFVVATFPDAIATSCGCP